MHPPWKLCFLSQGRDTSISPSSKLPKQIQQSKLFTSSLQLNTNEGRVSRSHFDRPLRRALLNTSGSCMLKPNAVATMRRIKSTSRFVAHREIKCGRRGLYCTIVVVVVVMVAAVAVNRSVTLPTPSPLFTYEVKVRVDGTVHRYTSHSTSITQERTSSAEPRVRLYSQASLSSMVRIKVIASLTSTTRDESQQRELMRSREGSCARWRTSCRQTIANSTYSSTRLVVPRGIMTTALAVAAATPETPALPLLWPICCCIAAAALLVKSGHDMRL
mmetsp:Transcript_29722/g.50221  ORF Transcript_29722/g.50221 Transcript_29722/m.50221 type:complete len:274 (+) Transcript_29722:275-1096(+)